MTPLELHWKVFGRNVKPISFSLLVSMLAIAIINIMDSGVLRDAFEGDVLGGWCLGVAMMLTLGWVLNNERLERGGLLGAFMAWFFRGVLVLLLGHVNAWEGWIMSFCWAIVAGGAYLLEKSKTDLQVRR